eukprot:CAMPEP_0197630968 /NCGR_PEP_ID=MMETSP1338-20131121/8289_1 /TAXON_ID=43686 ORGANISM="Pelagodinium beii, Strain RCC1491" /NCGR_SAMPLE_ID=MMETSP1338 /ASSEMBLY_ACC=CAM_ASM_000754 /LENGTH=39 /DNA_ID= /DNA_START= /DNA_END= /DNA_ORIENTATION=
MAARVAVEKMMPGLPGESAATAAAPPMLEAMKRKPMYLS